MEKDAEQLLAEIFEQEKFLKAALSVYDDHVKRTGMKDYILQVEKQSKQCNKVFKDIENHFSDKNKKTDKNKDLTL